MKEIKEVKCHNVKMLPRYFHQVERGNKTFEIRKDDREYKEGDFIVLHEHDNRVGGNGYSGRNITKRIGFVTGYEQQEGYVVFSLLDL